MRCLMVGAWLAICLISASCLTNSGKLFGQEVDSTAVAPTISPEHQKFFEAKIRPVLVEQCYRCHSNDGEAIRGGLTVDTREGLLGGGESGPAVVPGKLDESLLWTSINHLDFEMPPNRKLPPAVINDFRQWIEMGAPDPRVGEVANVQSKVTDEVIEQAKDYWAFQPPKRVEPPATTASSWPKNNIDRWVLAALDRQDLTPASDAPAEVLIRRLTFDLLGLPPTPQEIDAFVRRYQFDADGAIADTVNALLERPQFGERWGRHWLDVVRYAESSGKEVDLTFPHAWRYRDYVIDSFNDDKPYDRFLQEQIAGDLLPVNSDEEWTENLIATGFLALGPKTLIERNPRQFQADLVDEQIDVTTRVVLGISVACARCHDHKFDPIAQADYYALAGIFQSTETFFGGIPSQRVRQASNLLLLPVEDPLPSSEVMDPKQVAELRQQVKATEEELATAQRELRASVMNRDDRANAAQQARQRLQAIERRLAGLRAQANQYDDEGKPQSFCMGVQDRTAKSNARVLVRGEINQPAQAIDRGFVRVIGGDKRLISQQASGRLELAQWMTSETNPLTARVMVNRIWLHLLGQPLVPETDNFGASGQPPSHPELLDELAVSFMENGWSVKSLIRDIAQSRAYRLSAEESSQAAERDPENRFLSHANPRRLEAEAIRDAMLAVSGKLDLNRPVASDIARVGPAVLPPDGAIPPNLAAVLARSDRRGAIGIMDTKSELYRSIYLAVPRNSVPRSLEVFDFAEPTMVVGQREVSNTATQALYLMNNQEVIALSEAMAKRVNQEASNPGEAIELAFRLAYGRSPTHEERQASLRFLRQARQDVGEEVNREQQQPAFAGRNGRQLPQRLARRLAANRNNQPTPLDPFSQFCQALLVSVEFRYIQ